MGINNTTTITCDKCGATIASMGAALTIAIRQPLAGAKTLPYPQRQIITCSDACCAFVLNANATALTT